MKVNANNKWPGNPRVITDAQRSRLKKHLAELGDLSGVVYCRNQQSYVGGNQRSDVFNGAEIELIESYDKPTLNGTVAHGFIRWNGERYAYREVEFTEEQFRKACIVANNDGGAFDWEMLANWDAGELVEWGMELPDDWATEDEPLTSGDAEPQIDRAAELNEKWQVRPGDLWQIGTHRLLCGDSTKREDVERVMGGEKADAVCTDPPYGQNQPGVNNDSPAVHRELIDASMALLPIENGVVVAFQSPRTFTHCLDSLRAHNFTFERMLWMYKAAQCTFPWRGWILKSESILVFTRGEGQWQEVHPFAHDCYYLSEVSGELAPDSGWHGSVKPLAVVADLLSRTSALHSKVYEPFAGSGTTIVACENLNRHCRAIEISPDCCAVILERMTTAFPELEIRRVEAQATTV